MVLTLRQFSQTWWREVCKKVKKAVVFIDNEAAECLHWTGGLMELMAAGALGVKEFSSFESGKPEQKKAVFVTCSPIHDVTETILRDIIRNSRFEYCVLIYGAHPSVQRMARGGESDMVALQSLEDDLLQWMGNVNYTAEIFHMPLFLAPITDALFVTPGFGSLCPEASDLGESDRLVTHHLVSCLHSLFTQLNVREFIFSVGPLSDTIAGLLQDLPSAASRRKTSENRLSLILVDRTADLCTATKNNGDSFLDRILGVLPRLTGHANDVAVNMSPVCATKVSSVLDIHLAPGCLSQTDTEICPQVLEWLIGRKQKDIMLSLSQHLSAVSFASKGERVPSRVTPHSLEKQVTAFRGDADAILVNNGVLQQTLAVIQTLKSPRCAHLDYLVSLELLQKQQGTAALVQTSQLIKTRHQRKLSVEDCLCLLVHLYSSSCEILFSDSEESQLEVALTEALYEDRQLLTGTLATLISEETSESTVANYATQICDKLQCLPSERYEYLREGNGLMQQLISDLLDPSRPEIPDLNAKSSALTDLLTSGFGLFMNKPSLKHPLDNPRLMIFVVGGISAREVKVVQDAVTASGQSVDVMVGGTSLVTPVSLMQTVLFSDLLID